MNTFSLSDDQIVIAVCSLLLIALAFLMVRLWKRKQRMAMIPVVVLIVFVAAVVWFFSTFQIRLM